MIRILGRVCQGEQWGYLEYSGKLSHEQREKALEEFKNNPEKNILLASLKCGGLGLNLTMVIFWTLQNISMKHLLTL